MATFIAYQPRANEPAFRNRVFHESSTVGPCGQLSDGRSSRSPQQARSVGNADFVALVDLTTSDQDAAREYLVAREILEPMAHIPGKRGIQVAGPRTNSVTDKIEHCEKRNKNEGGDVEIDTDHESEISDLPSLADIILRSDPGFGGSADLRSEASTPPALGRTGKECWRESDCENSAQPTATTSTGIQPGASQDNPIVLDDYQPVSFPDAAASEDGNPTLEVVNQEPPSSPSPTLSGGTAELSNEGGKDDPDSLSLYKTDNPTGDQKEGGSNESHKDDALHARIPTNGSGCDECSDSGTGSDAPASVGRIHDVFAEFEETFGMARRKQKAVVTAVRDCPDRDDAAGSIPPPVSQGGPRPAADDGAADMELFAQTVHGGDIGHSYLSKGEIENGSPFQSEQESDGRETQTEDVRSQCVSTLTSDCHSGSASAFTRRSSSPPAMVIHEASEPVHGIVTQGVRRRKRTQSSTQPNVLSGDGAPRKRPRRAIKETWKAREARESRERVETKPPQTSLKPYRKEQTS